MNSLEKIHYDKLICIITGISKEIQEHIEYRYYDYIDLTGSSMEQRLSYVMAPHVVLLLLNDPDFAKLCIHHNDSVIEQHKSESQIESHKKRPSSRTIAKCEFIVRELEKIAESFTTLAINRETLWKQLIQRCANNVRFKLGGKKNTLVIEMATHNQWDRESLTHHMDLVIEWHKQNNQQVYLQNE